MSLYRAVRLAAVQRAQPQDPVAVLYDFRAGWRARRRVARLGVLAEGYGVHLSVHYVKDAWLSQRGLASVRGAWPGVLRFARRWDSQVGA